MEQWTAVTEGNKKYREELYLCFLFCCMVHTTEGSDSNDHSPSSSMSIAFFHWEHDRFAAPLSLPQCEQRTMIVTTRFFSSHFSRLRFYFTTAFSNESPPSNIFSNKQIILLFHLSRYQRTVRQNSIFKRMSAPTT